MSINCNHDCLNCPYPDVPAECLEAPITHEEYKKLEEIERDIINPKTAQQRKVAARKKAYYEANKDKVAAWQRAYYEANKDKLAAWQRAYRKANKDKLAAWQRAYRKANKDKLAAQQNCIAQIRKARGMTQVQLAALIGVAQSTISAFERGALVADWGKLCAVLPELGAYRP